MKLFDVYPLYNVEPTKAEGCYVFDKEGKKYLDLYGGHAVISIGHSHPHYVKSLKDQLDKIGFYSNSIQNSLQLKLAESLGRISGCEDYQLFLCNSGAEANENALKVASFVTGKSKVIAFENGFHGRTSAAVAATHNPKIQAPINNQQEVVFLPLNDINKVKSELAKNETCAVIIEPIQGVGGLDMPEAKFIKEVESLCKQYDTMLILDEVQSGFGRSGKFFAHQYWDIKPDIISIAKGMGNGFPVGGILISDTIEASYGMLGTTFGGNHLACAATQAVLDVIEEEGLIENTNEMGAYLKEKLANISQIKQIKGSGLMLGLEFDFEIANLRRILIYDYQIFTGGSANKKLLRILPPLTITKKKIDLFVVALQKALITD
ncbi:aspartate aminotransferase family protein [Spongiivirga citrea]|uniref:Aminotransferase class III-fold pyridoxal phosphate-dependent enzyme n=1 Tax=Spongiivirga citrea TaxID=1481457 RepID=A0A6M0CG13_9FLAO|nr:aminotransferase class III-fold pyridoxal phosphate-dependent enzyme [Spongiivirga citrea]NER16392.1 aminotransferase class III-fold pyridoxal phosphate-dependent enzyme [Spongiivirga citrea]